MTTTLCDHCVTVARLNERYSYLAGREQASQRLFAPKPFTEAERAEKSRVYAELKTAELLPCDMTRKLDNGTWLHASELNVWRPTGVTEDGDPDGRYERVVIISGETTAGRQYVCTVHFETLAEAKAHMLALPGDLRLKDAGDWTFVRNVYGSAAYVIDGDEEAEIEREREERING